MMSKRLLVLVLLACWARAAAAESVRITPVHPRPGDAVRGSLTGTWSDSCVPRNAIVARNGLLITVVTDFGSAGGCAQVVTPYTVDMPLGTLARGSYHLQFVGVPPGGSQRLLAETWFSVADPVEPFAGWQIADNSRNDYRLGYQAVLDVLWWTGPDPGSRQGFFVLHPISPDVPAVLRWEGRLPPDAGYLRFEAGAMDGQSFVQCRVNGVEVQASTVTGNGWQITCVDVSPYRDTDVSIDLDVWPGGSTGPYYGYCAFSAVDFRSQCVTPNDTGSALLLAGERFRVTLDYSGFGANPLAGHGTGHLMADNVGSFGTVDPNSADVIVKIVDFCAFNGSWSVYIGGTTDIRTEVVVTDLATGRRSRTFVNPLGKDFQLIKSAEFPCE